MDLDTSERVLFLREQLAAMKRGCDDRGDAAADLRKRKAFLFVRETALRSNDLGVRENAIVNEVLGIAYSVEPGEIREGEATPRLVRQARALVAARGAREVLASDWRTIRRGLAPANYDDRTVDEPLPGWVVELAMNDGYLSERARIVVSLAEPERPFFMHRYSYQPEDADRLFACLQDLVDPDPAVRLPATVRHFIEQVWGVGVWNWDDPEVFENVAAHLDEVGLDDAMFEDPNSPFRAAAFTRLMDLTHQVQEREGYYVESVRESLYEATRTFETLRARRPSGSDLELLDRQFEQVQFLEETIRVFTVSGPAERAAAEVTTVIRHIEEAKGLYPASFPHRLRPAVRAFIDRHGGFDRVVLDEALLTTVKVNLPGQHGALRVPPYPDADGWKASYDSPSPRRGPSL